MAYWLLKSEPNTYGINDLSRDRTTNWDGVRNFQARNFLREMRIGDTALIYHSVVEPIGVAGVAEVIGEALPDETQFDRHSRYFDSGASKDNPRWYAPRIRFKRKYKSVLALERLREEPKLSELILLKRGNRLSVMPITARQFQIINDLAENI